MDQRLILASCLILFITTVCGIEVENQSSGHADAKNDSERDPKLFNVFTIVRFPNDPCQGDSGTARNGTCYTENECSAKGGSNAGACAQGFGVCCVFIASCGASVAENCTYFESSGGEIGACSIEICPCSSDICQMRLDFSQMVITGPSTSTVTVGKSLAGTHVPTGNGVAYTLQTQCLTDSFTVSGSSTGQNTPPTICGTNTGEHMYADMEGDDCNTLAFQLGGSGIDATIPTRTWSIKVTQIDCNSDLRAPQGCTQWFYGSNSQMVRSFNFNAGAGTHLANQNQNVCVRKERGNCKICWSAVDPRDVDTNGKNADSKGTLGAAGKGECCSYKTDGAGTKGYDCIVIPGAAVGTMCVDFMTVMNANVFCGNSGGLAKTKSAKTDGTKSGTICTKSDPFSIRFLTDAWEAEEETKEDMAPMFKPGSGFQLAYFMSSNNC